MGAWGEGPLDNDRVADWMHDLFTGTRFAERVAEALDSGDPDRVRGAAWLVAVLGQVYVWPIDRLDADRARARRALEALRADEDWLAGWGDRDAVAAALGEELAAIPVPVDTSDPPADIDVDPGSGPDGDVSR